MSITPGTRIGAYEVITVLGAGGMGEVYRARDPRLNRDVAIKVLPALVTGDAERVARFQREAHLLASLHHPNIAQIYGFEDVSGTKALVLELVDGPTLADLIARGRVPVDEAIGIAKQIADALSAAHDQGVVHRDLKPANIKLTKDGTVKVLDFGLAKEIQPSDSAPGLSLSPTITSPALMTSGGMILGTAAYMSPEQARGKAIDRRSDIWAFGCVLYEMLTGRRAFDGEDITDVLSKVLQREPDFGALGPQVPPRVHELLRRCLEKDRKRRLADIADARYELDEATATKPATIAPPRANRRGWHAAALAAAALAGAASAALGLRSAGSPAVDAQPISFTLDLPEGLTGVGVVSVSPDGQYLAFSGGPPWGIWLRRLDTAGARLLPGTEGTGQIIWSPDSRAIAFAAEGSLKRLEIASGSITTITTGRGVSPAWGPAGTILFMRGNGLMRLNATGGSPTVVLDDIGMYSHPSFLPDGERFLLADFRALTPQRGAGTVYLGSLGSREKKELLRADSRAVFANGHILFVHNRMLRAQAFDLASGTVSGDPATIAENVWPGSVGMPWLSASDNGVLAFPVLDTPNSQLAWLDRSGKLVANVTEPGEYSNARVSPDGSKVVLGIFDPRARSRDIWVLVLERGTRTRLTQDPGDEMNPVWSPDGQSIAFSSDRNGQRDVFRRSADGSGEDVLLVGNQYSKSVNDWAPDGKTIMFNGPHANGDGLSLVDAAARPGAGATAYPMASPNPQSAQFSPDGRWVVFSSNSTGRQEVYAASLSGKGGSVILSTQGGIQPRWSRDGREIFYLTLERDRIMVVPVTVGETLRAGAVRELFKVDVADVVGSHLYDVSPDGQRFLVNIRVGPRITPIRVMVNWPAVLRKRSS